MNLMCQYVDYMLIQGKLLLQKVPMILGSLHLHMAMSHIDEIDIKEMNKKL